MKDGLSENCIDCHPGRPPDPDGEEVGMRGSRPLSSEEVHRLLEAFDGPFRIRNRNMFQLTLNTGARASEILSLRVNQVWNGKQPVAHLTLEASQTKVGKSRTIPLNDAARFAIAELMAWKQAVGQDCSADARLFISKKGTKLTRRQTFNIISGAARKAGLSSKIGCHTARKSCGTMMAQKNVPLMVIAEILGHGDLQTLTRYLGVGREELEKAVNGLRF